MRGRKNHGVREERCRKYHRRQVLRRRRYQHSLQKYYYQYPYLTYRLYLRGPHVMTLVPPYLLPVHELIYRPQHQPLEPPTLEFSPTWVHGDVPPHGKIVVHFGPHPKPYQYRQLCGAQCRTVERYGRCVRHQTKAEIIEGAALRWLFSTDYWNVVGGGSFPEVGWPDWDPLGRLPRQHVWGYNL
jgi:hypothetical protein